MKVSKRLAVMAAAGAAATSLMTGLRASGATVYFDLNAGASGSGITNGTWAAWNASNWSSDSSGGVATSAWADSAGTDVVFSAGADVPNSSSYYVWGGSNATGSSQTRTMASLKVLGGNVTLFQAVPTGTYNGPSGTGSVSVNSISTISTGVIDVDTGATANVNHIINSTLGMTKLGAGTLVYGPTSNNNSVKSHSFFTNVAAGTFKRAYVAGADGWRATDELWLNSGATFDVNGNATGFRAMRDGSSGGGSLVNTSTTASALTFDVLPGFDGSFSGAINQTSGTISLVKAGFGNQTFSGAVSYTGTTAIQLGGLVFDHGANNGGKLANALLTINVGSVKVVGNDSASSSEAVSGLTLGTATSSGAVAVSVVSGNNQNATFNLGTITRTVLTAGTLDVSLTNTGTGNASVLTTSVNTGYGLVGTGTATTNTAAYATVNGGRDWAVKSTGTTSGSGNLVAMTSAYTSQNNVASWAASQHVTSGSSSGFTGSLGSSLAINSLRFNAPGTANLGSSTLTVNSGGVLVTPDSGSTASSITGGTLTTSSVNELVVHQHNTSAAFTISSKISGAIVVTKTGGGTLILDNAGASSYTGATRVLNGVLSVTADGALGTTAGNTQINGFGTLELRNPNGTSSTFNYATAEPITLDGSRGGYNGMGSLYVPVGAVNFAGPVTVGLSNGRMAAINVAANAELTLSNTSNALVWSNGNPPLTKMGDGTLTIASNAANNNAVGSINVDGGTLKLSGNGTLAGTNGIFFNIGRGASLVLDNTSTNNTDRIQSTSTSGWGLLCNTGTVKFIGNASADSYEAISPQNGNMRLTGQNLVDIQRGGGRSAILNLYTSNGPAITRTNGGVLLVRGTRLGATDYSGSTNGNSSNLILSGSSSNGFLTMYGTTTYSSNASAINLKIVPFIVGQEGSTGDGDTFVTYDGTVNALATGRGIVPLTAVNYYTTNVSGATGTDSNVKVTGGDVISAAKTINSLILSNSSTASALTISGTSNLSVTSGAIMTLGAGNVTISAPVVASGGPNEAFFFVNGGSTQALTVGKVTSAALTKAGTGVLNLNATGSSMTTAINVSGGTLLINATGAAGSAPVYVAYGATLGGSGSTTGNVAVALGGRVAPGNSPGTLSTGNLVMDASSTYEADITGTGAGQFDTLNVTGIVNLYADYSNSASVGVPTNPDPALLGAKLALNVSGLTGADVGSTFTLIANDGTDVVFGRFAGLAQGATVTAPGGYSFTVNYAGGTGNDVVLTFTGAPVPEPTALGLAGVGALGFLARRRRQAR